MTVNSMIENIKSDYIPSRTFSYSKSTEENHSSNSNKYYGPWAHIRAKLDYTYHKNYTEDRQRLQNSLIDSMLENVFLTDVNGNICTTPTNPFIVFTAGAMGAGKGHTVNYLVEKGYFPLQGFVVIDPDEIRRRLPEYSVYVAHCPEMAGELTRKEAGYVAEILTAAALQAGKNALVDGSLRDWKWYTQYFHQLKEEYKNLSIAILHVKAPREAVFERAMNRAKLTGRLIPQHTLEMALEEVPKSVKILSPLADYFCELNNEPGNEIEIVTPNITWESFERHWLQTCAWVPKSNRREQLISNDLKSFRASVQRFLRSVDLDQNVNCLGRQSQTHSLFSTSLSTEENYCDVNNDHLYYGPYSHIRREMDYIYYSNYVKERQWLQDSVIEYILKEPILVSQQENNDNPKTSTKSKFVVDNPWLIFVAGGEGVGKSYCLRQLIKRKKLTLNSFIYSTINIIRSHIPEYTLYDRLASDQNGKNDGDGTTCNMHADEATFKESLYIQDILITAAMQFRQNALINIAPETIQHYLNVDFLQRIRENFSIYRIALIHVVSPDDNDDPYQSVKDESQVKENNENFEIQTIHQNVSKVTSMVDFYCELSNRKSADCNVDNAHMKIVVPNDMSWDDFQKNWEQSYCRANSAKI